jgi:hypothetical protein
MTRILSAIYPSAVITLSTGAAVVVTPDRNETRESLARGYCARRGIRLTIVRPISAV